VSKGSLATIVMLASLGASGRAIPSASPQGDSGARRHV